MSEIDIDSIQQSESDEDRQKPREKSVINSRHKARAENNTQVMEPHEDTMTSPLVAAHPKTEPTINEQDFSKIRPKAKTMNEPMMADTELVELKKANDHDFKLNKVRHTVKDA